MSSDRVDELMEELKRHPVEDIYGVVNVGGAVGMHYPQKGAHFLRFTFAAWKSFHGDMQTRELRVWQEMNETDLRVAMFGIRPYDIIHVRARVAEQNVFEEPQGLLVELLGKITSQSDLLAHAARLQQPVCVEDDRFGIFTLEQCVNIFETETAWGDTKIELFLSMEGLGFGEVDGLLTTARELWQNQSAWDKRIAEFAVTYLLRRKPDVWLYEINLSPEQLRTRMQLALVTLYHKSRFEFWYDSDVFRGGMVLVSGTLSAGPETAELVNLGRRKEP